MNVKTEQNLNIILVFLFTLPLLGVYGVQYFMNYAQPCPLCLLIRSAMIGSAAALLLNVFSGFSSVKYIFSILFILSGTASALLLAWLDGCINYRCSQPPQVPFLLFGIDLAILALCVFLFALLYVIILMVVFRGRKRNQPLPKLNWWHRFVCALIFLLSLSNVLTTWL